MVTLRTLALLAAATLVASQTIESLDPCGQTCYSDVKAKAGTFGCAADDMSCLCAVADFKNGVHDCAKGACPAGYGDTVLAAVNALCATAAPAAPTPEPTTAAPAPPEATSTPTPEAPITSTVPTSSISEAAATSSTTPTASSTTTSTTPVVAGGAPTSTSTEEAAAKTTEPTTTSTTSTSESETTSTPGSSQTNEPAGLPVAAKAGIGIGAGAAAVAIFGLVAWVLARQRRSKRANGFSSKHMIKISDPAPGGGRAFAGDNHYETGLSELEMKSRRYEDMVPRQQPRHMV
ncbi:hypothetical protein V8F33_012673 [Rhypophila sp. PSN 637]